MAARLSDNLPLRERKKAITRQALIDAAERLFEERGFDAVTVAEIADAANVSVKTLFVYFRSKEDLAFADQGLIDAFVAALAARPAGVTAAAAIAQVLIDAIEPGDVQAGLEGFHRGYGRSTALESGLLRMWADYEDRITAELAREDQAKSPYAQQSAAQLAATHTTTTHTTTAHTTTARRPTSKKSGPATGTRSSFGEPSPQHRSHAMHLVALARLMTADETRASVAHLSASSATAQLKTLLLIEADAVARAFPS